MAREEGKEGKRKKGKECGNGSHHSYLHFPLYRKKSASYKRKKEGREGERVLSSLHGLSTWILEREGKEKMDYRRWHVLLILSFFLLEGKRIMAVARLSEEEGKKGKKKKKKEGGGRRKKEE